MWPFDASWWWGKRISKIEEDIMSLQQDAIELKALLDEIAADVGPIKAGIDALTANLEAALADDASDPDPDLLKGVLSEAKGLRDTIDNLAAGFAKAGSPIPETANPAPEPQTEQQAPADPPAPVDPPAASGDGSTDQKSADGTGAQTSGT